MKLTRKQTLKALWYWGQYPEIILRLIAKGLS